MCVCQVCVCVCVFPQERKSVEGSGQGLCEGVPASLLTSLYVYYKYACTCVHAAMLNRESRCLCPPPLWDYVAAQGQSCVSGSVEWDQA